MLQQLKNVNFGSKLISFIFILVIIMDRLNIFAGFKIAFQANSLNRIYLFVIALGLLFLIFNLVAAIGIFFLKKWGFIFAYIAILFSTLLFSTAYIPFIPRILPVQFRWIALILINVTFLSYIIYIHAKLRHKNQLLKLRWVQ